MSWSINYIGSPENVSAALDKHSDEITGQSKAEYDAALPHIKAFDSQNTNVNYPIAIKVDANGHGDTAGNNAVNVTIGYVGILA
ncbi:MAG: hypothetical protein P4L31_07370 [Candidatus Babeliales bacterium]|nr:hypothetical protein [Candidatus Babeliales bacterium]